MRGRWEAFGWEVIDMEGNDIQDIVETFDQLNYSNAKPKLVIAHTTKGNGVSFMEKLAKWHHGVPNEEQYNLAITEIDEKIKTLNEE